MKKKESKIIVFSFDGTGNEPSDAGGFIENESITNVLKLHLLMGGGMSGEAGQVLGDGQGRQFAFYYNGIGTREEGRSVPLLGRAVSAINMMIAPSWGDANRILREAKSDFQDVYRNGDRVVVFGYSRGAALARKFVSQLLNGERYSGVGVAFLGVFDTVAAMNGIQRRGEDVATDVLFENGTLHGGVVRAVHIVALDEDRVLFRPTLINKDRDPNNKRITEVWLPGIHGDVGGGYWHDGLSDVALDFMIEECVRTLKNNISICCQHSRDDISNLLNQLRGQDEELAGIDVDDVISRPLINGPVHAHSGALVRAGGRECRFVRVNEDDRASGCPPLVHRSVLDRFRKVPAYRPPALRRLVFKLWDTDDYCEDVQGVTGLSELVALDDGNR